MDNKKDISRLKNSVFEWNNWRKEHNNERIVLRNINLFSEFYGEDGFHTPNFNNVNFTNTDFNCASFRNCVFVNCSFDDSKITFSDLVDASFESCTFQNVDMRVSKIGNAKFRNCNFEKSDLSYCSAEETSFIGSKIIDTKMECMSFVKSDFTNTDIINCRVYGISSWDINTTNANQSDIIVTPSDSATLTVENIETAQFIYLILNNNKIRQVIDTITSKTVLILGNFSPDRKAILDQIKIELRKYNLVPMMFDFEKPTNRNFTETVMTLAAMSKFVIVDLSSPRSVPHELGNTIKELPSVEFYPIIVKGEKEYGMFADYESYHWVKEKREYTPDIIERVVCDIVEESKQINSETSQKS